MASLPGLSAMTESRELQPVPGMPASPAGALDALTALLEADARQRGASLRAAFTLHNAGASALALVNPIDLLKWQLVDASGAPVALPERAPNFRLHRPAGAEWKLDSAIPIAGVAQDGAAVDASVLDEPAIRLAADGRLSVTFAFELASGGYALTALATLIDADDPTRSRILRSEPLPVELSPTT